MLCFLLYCSGLGLGGSTWKLFCWDQIGFGMKTLWCVRHSEIDCGWQVWVWIKFRPDSSSGLVLSLTVGCCCCCRWSKYISHSRIWTAIDPDTEFNLQDVSQVSVTLYFVQILWHNNVEWRLLNFHNWMNNQSWAGVTAGWIHYCVCLLWNPHKVGNIKS